MIAKLIGRIVALPVRVVAAPLRMMERSVSGDDRRHPGMPGTILRDAADAIERSIEEIGR